MGTKIQNFVDNKGHRLQLSCKKEIMDVCSYCDECKEYKQYINLNQYAPTP